jgi:hypothetical protein
MIVMIQNNIFFCSARTVIAEIYEYNFRYSGYESLGSTKAPSVKD